MVEIFLRTLPFFAIIGLGFLAGRTRFFSQEATANLTRFVFYFALSAMLFRFAASLDFGEVFNLRLIAGYLWGTAFLYGIAMIIAFLRRQNLQYASIEAQCAVIGNVGFLGLPMFVILFGEAAIGPMMMILATDLIVFSSLIVILINGSRDGRMHWGILRSIGLGLLRNPMIVAMTLGLIWSGTRMPIPWVMDEFLTLLGAAATPGALFAIGASLAGKSAERIEVAGWLTICKLVLHPIFVAIGVLLLFRPDAYSAAIAIAAAGLPVAGNIFMLAQHYGIAPQRVSAAILVSTAFSIVTLPLLVAWIAV